MKYLVIIDSVSRTPFVIRVRSEQALAIQTTSECIATCDSSERALARVARWNREQAS